MLYNWTKFAFLRFNCLIDHGVENNVLKQSRIDNDPNRSLLSFRHLEMFWHIQEHIRNAQHRFVFLNFFSCVKTFMRDKNSIDQGWSLSIVIRNCGQTRVRKTSPDKIKLVSCFSQSYQRYFTLMWLDSDLSFRSLTVYQLDFRSIILTLQLELVFTMNTPALI